MWTDKSLLRHHKPGSSFGSIDHIAIPAELYSLALISRVRENRVDGTMFDKKPKLQRLLRRSDDEAAQQSKPYRTRRTVVLTGSTGSMGSYLLDCLLATWNIDKIYCLNRSSDARDKQLQSHRTRGLTTDFASTKSARSSNVSGSHVSTDPSSDRVEFLTYDLTLPHLGLDSDVHALLQNTVTHILHNAWPVNFNQHFSTFEPAIIGARALIDFVAATPHVCTLFFVSSIAVAGDWGKLPGSRAKVPETILHDWRVARMGYGQSKLVTERIIAEAVATGVLSHTQAAICRVGQVAGPVLRGQYGEWSRREWMPSLIQSSKFLGKLPRTLGPVDAIDWIPVDVLAQVLVELMLLPPDKLAQNKGTKKDEPAVWHIVNPETISWTTLLPAVQASLGAQAEVEDFVDWVDALKASATRESVMQDVEINPAVKLVRFFEDVQDKAVRFPKASSATLDTFVTVKSSRTLGSLPPVTPEWMELWMQQWQF